MVTQRQLHYLEAMGIDVWVRRQSDHQLAAALLPGTGSSASPIDPETDQQADWAQLESEVRDCQRCALRKGCRQTVFGVGNKAARWLVIGEAPGAEEDRQGEPFVGRAGQLLNNMLLAIGLERREVYIANVLKCRPPANRDPAPEEAQACEPYLRRQIALLQPRIILAVGRIAAQNLLKTTRAISQLRHAVHTYGPDHIPLVMTYHPAYLLRSPREKAKAWQDLQLARRVFQDLSRGNTP